MTRPLIGVTGGERRWPVAWWFIRWALWRCGARACRMTPRNPQPSAALDGIVISGGDDIDPGLYMPDAPDTAPADPERDAFEIEALKRAIDGGIPILGICRGAQLLNVVLGGRLHADLRRIRQKTSNRRSPLACKTLQVEPETRLADILRKEQCRINSLHHQAISELGQDLVVSGRDIDGIVQAVENPHHPFMFGVQWHPEYLPLRAPQLRLFNALVDVCK
ncbi:MAG: gamma-glutamyl-gamma-aminobutyrate hydrolase family protein [Salinisphaeraceae bacterium]|nr:gamma-glutamyl-gamma-aminobutyrate hydrolase family protein [Salinisphaeraceae bacterium]